MDYDKRWTLRLWAQQEIDGAGFNISISPAELIELLDYIDELENDLTVETHYGE